MSVYKSLLPSDVNIREFYAYKEFQLTESDINNHNLKVVSAREVTSSYFYDLIAFEQTSSRGYGIYPRTLYDSIKHLYYHKDSILEYTSSNLYTGVINSSPIETNVTGTSLKQWSGVYNFYNPFFNFGPNGNDIYKNLGSSAVVVSIPQSLFGERLKPGSIHVEDVTEGFTLYDDGEGNLYDSTESSSFASNKSGYHRGNVFYEHGNIVITSQSGSYQNYGTGSNNIVVKFKSTEKIYELEAICTAKEGEFNLTMNPSARVSRSLLISEPLGFVTGSGFATYPTTVGLYDDDGTLLAIGKMAQPLRNDPELGITFVVRLYW